MVLDRDARRVRSDTRARLTGFQPVASRHTSSPLPKNRSQYPPRNRPPDLRAHRPRRALGHRLAGPFVVTASRAGRAEEEVADALYEPILPQAPFGLRLGDSG